MRSNSFIRPPFTLSGAKRSRSAVLLSMAALLLSACSGGAIVDRTQPNYVRKSELQGTWYLMDTIVEVPPTSPLAFEGAQGTMEKVQFEIQENYLVAYRSYEFIVGADPAVDR